MPVKLIIPERTRFTTPFSVSFKSSMRPYLRKEAMESAVVEREALMRVVLICTTLWGGFWIQFLTTFLYESPAIYTLSGGNWFYPSVYYYLDDSNPFPWPLAGTFAMMSMFGSALGLVGGWISSRKSRAKWRMRFAVMIFSTIIVGWSVAGLLGEEAAWRGLDRRLEVSRKFAEEDRDDPDEWYWRVQVERLEALAKKRGNRAY